MILSLDSDEIRYLTVAVISVACIFLPGDHQLDDRLLKLFYESQRFTPNNNHQKTSMKTITSFFSIALVASLFVSTSCSDDDDVVKSKTDLLTEKSWSVTKAEMRTSSSSTDFDVTAMFVMDYEKDNTITFLKDNTYKENVGADDGDGAEENSTGTWAWKDGEKVITITLDDFAQDSEVLVLNATTLKVNAGKMEFDTNGDGIDDDEVSIFYTLTAK